MSMTRCSASSSSNLFARASNKNEGAVGSKLITLSLFKDAVDSFRASSAAMLISANNGMETTCTGRPCTTAWTMQASACTALNDRKRGRASGGRMKASAAGHCIDAGRGSIKGRKKTESVWYPLNVRSTMLLCDSRNDANGRRQYIDVVNCLSLNVQSSNIQRGECVFGSSRNRDVSPVVRSRARWSRV
ncbi:hypothetical protein CVT25_006493 [Psilocybe cyanescens]|uniref:Uncharacterized protein n=1 Tax=Psilocybe cyanescens TaxID=93625 RepID=A0A409XEF6_PSICY|nr:hypothetical protein CVT25_006493 [Psilocybe cyanescens]